MTDFFRASMPIYMAGLLLAFSCDVSNAPSGETNEMPAEVADAVGSIWPEPSRYIQGIPIYEKYDDIAPIFNFSNDTTYVINFWATWCGPCVKELPYFEALTSKYEGKPVQVVLVSLDFPKQLESKLVPFMEKNQLTSKVVVLLDGKYNNWIDKISPDWEGAIPATLIYKEGKEKFVGTSVESLEELEGHFNDIF